MSRRILVLGAVALLSGCGSSDSAVEAPPKGPPPSTSTAPPGVPGPEERTKLPSGGTTAPDPGSDAANGG